MFTTSTPIQHIEQIHGTLRQPNIVHARYAREFLLQRIHEWNTPAKRLIEDIFYDFVNRASKPSGYMSFEVLSNPECGVSKDHWFNPRILCRSIMDSNQELLHNEQAFIELFYTSATTVKVTKPQNQELKRTINKQLTINKYDNYGWYFSNYGVAAHIGEPFPLKHLVPNFYTQYEITLLTTR